MVLNSVDLFTGIAGFTLAFEGIAKPLLYCDNNPHVIRWLNSKMAVRAIPNAPIVHDVAKLADIKRAVAGRHVHLLTAGFPCIGFSKYGWRQGLKNAHSGLFSDTVNVIRALGPDMVVFENVRELQSANEGRDLQAILRAMHELRYSIRWTSCSAKDVGAPHLRRRWFALCVRRGARTPVVKVPASDKLRTWTRPPPPLISRDAGISASRRQVLLGNSLIPLVARLAFFRLYTAFTIVTVEHLVSARGKMVGYTERLPGRLVSRKVRDVAHGQLDSTGLVMCQVGKEPSAATCIVVDPAHYATRKPYVENPSRPVKSPAIDAPVVRRLWPTPRTGGITHSHNLSERTIHDLSTMAMYASSVDGVKMPRTKDGQRVNTHFVEWLMGYSQDHTMGADAS